MTIEEDRINDLLDAEQKPFNNRLEVVCYLALFDSDIQGSQDMMQREAKRLAAFLQDHMYLDVDRGAA